MNISYKLKIRQKQDPKDEPMVRRIRTDHLDALRKTNKQPLNDNRKLLNYNQSSQASKLSKKPTVIKSILNKNNNSNVTNPTKNSNYSRMVTEANEKTSYHQRTATAIEKNPGSSYGHRKTNTSSNLTFKKKQTVKDSSSKPTYAMKPTVDINKSTKNEKPFVGSNRYEIDKQVGSGTFGTVHKARDKKTLEIVAIKKVYQDKNYKNRELDILKMLNHPNVLSMKDSYFTYDKLSSKEYLNVVMDYYGANLYESIKKNTRKNPMPRLQFKMYAYQLFRSLLYLRTLNIAHRDIKPQNVLVNQNRMKLVMCDFGSAKVLKAGEPNIAYICSRCYRAPQLIFGNTEYTTQIDMWSTGCVLAQMLICQPLFQGESNIDQLAQIIKVLGCPSSSQIRQMNPDYDLNKFQLPKIGAESWNKIFPNGAYLGEQFIDLMKNVLCYSPKSRFSPFQALAHSFFDELRDETVYTVLKSQYQIDNIFDFGETGQISLAQMKELVPEWY